MIEILVDWPDKVKKIGVSPLKNIGGKNTKLSVDFLQRPTSATLIANISITP